MTAPRTVRIRVWRATSESFLAAAAGSSETNAIAVGPWSMSTRSGCSASSAARLASVFLATWKDAPTSRSAPRTSAICVTVRPR